MPGCPEGGRSNSRVAARWVSTRYRGRSRFQSAECPENLIDGGITRRYRQASRVPVVGPVPPV